MVEWPAWYAHVSFMIIGVILQLLVLQSDPQMIKEIVEAVTIPVMAKVRIGHFVEAQVGLSIEMGRTHYNSCVPFRI
jgi:hypothetical protein